VKRFRVEICLTLHHDCPVESNERPEHEPHLGVAAVARRIGVAPGTLRTWDRRYGIGPSDHSGGAHRRYSEEDLARVLYMRKLIIEGVPPVDAASAALALVHPQLRSSSSSEPTPSPESDLVLIAQLHRAAKALERELIESTLAARLETHSIEETWHNVLVPLLVIVGDDWARTGEGIEIEHLLSDLILRLFNSRITSNSEKVNPRPVLIASIGEETHSLAITALAAALSERGILIQFLGARTPASAINEVVRRSAPPAIFLWAQLRKNADLSYISDLPSVRPKPLVIVGGPGWSTQELKGATLATDLMSACSDIERAVGL